jgi:hypothetical protein
MLTVGYANPVAFIEAAAKSLNPNINQRPYLSVLAGEFPPRVALLDVWMWSYVAGSKTNDAAAKKKAEKAVKDAQKRGLSYSVEKSLYGVLVAVCEGVVGLNIAAIGDEPGRVRGKTRRESISQEVSERRAAGAMTIPALRDFDVDETAYYSVIDTLKAASREIISE